MPEDPNTPEQQSAEASQPAAIAEEALQSAQTAADAIQAELPDFAGASGGAQTAAGLSLLSDVDLRLTIELGRTQMYVEDVLRLNEDSIIELDRAAGDPVDIYVNDRHVARGEVLVLNDSFCVRVSEIVQNAPEEE